MDFDPNLIQQMPIQLISKWANPHYSPTNELELTESLMMNGVQEPIVLGVGVWSRQVRLDTGNHRIYLCPRLGMTHLPVIARVWNYCAFSNGNGDHSYPCSHITPKKEWIEKEYWARPNEVLDIFELLKSM